MNHKMLIFLIAFGCQAGSLYLLDNPLGTRTKNGTIIQNSPLLVLDNCGSNWCRVLTPDRKIFSVKVNSPQLHQIKVENKTLEVLAKNPEQGRSDTVLKFSSPFSFEGVLKNRFPIDSYDMMLWGEDRYYPVLKITSAERSGFINAASLRLNTDSMILSGLILCPFINSATDSEAFHSLQHVKKAYQYQDGTLIKISPSKNASQVKAMIRNATHLQGLGSIYSFGDKWLFCYGDSIIELTFNESYPQHIMDYRKVELKEGRFVLVIELGYIFGDGIYGEILIVPGSYKSFLKTKKINFSGISGESTEDVQNTWYIKGNDLIIKSETGKHQTYHLNKILE
jgi:hypothetical protein